MPAIGAERMTVSSPAPPVSASAPRSVTRLPPSASVTRSKPAPMSTTVPTPSAALRRMVSSPAPPRSTSTLRTVPVLPPAPRCSVSKPSPRSATSAVEPLPGATKSLPAVPRMVPP